MTNDANFHTGPFGDPVLNRNAREITLNAKGIDDDFPNAYVLLANYLKHFVGGHSNVETLQDLKRALRENILGYEKYLEIRGKKDRQNQGIEEGAAEAESTIDIILKNGVAETIAEINMRVERCNQLRTACLDAYEQFAAAIAVAPDDPANKEKRDAFGNKALELNAELQALNLLVTGRED
jgi:hypothetical protein